MHNELDCMCNLIIHHDGVRAGFLIKLLQQVGEDEIINNN